MTRRVRTTGIAVILLLAVAGGYVANREIVARRASEAPARSGSGDPVKTAPAAGARPAGEAKDVIGPVFGWFDEKTFTVSAVTDKPAEWSLALDKPGFTVKRLHAEPESYQTFEVTRSADAPPLDVLTRVGCILHMKPRPGEGAQADLVGTASVGPLGSKWSFVALGDSRTHVDRWSAVIAAAGRKDPAFIVHSGDFVHDGRVFREWVDQFWTPAAPVLSKVPLYGVMGNHEEDTVLFDRVIPIPGARDCWSQARGPLLMVGVDGSQDWSPSSKLYKELDARLAASRAPFVVVFSHYPPLSSCSMHGGVNEKGDYVEPDMRRAHDDLLPLCVKHHVTAFIAGHEHCYERSDYPGLQVVTSGGAGAPTYGQALDPARRNPYSKVYFAGLNFLLFTVTGEELRMEALTPEGKRLDVLTWKPRPGAP